MITPPSQEEIKNIFPHFNEITFLNAGGFKAVYKVILENKTEAFKIIHIPEIGAAELKEEFKKESISRIEREIKILNSCSAPEIVKLGSMQPVNITIKDTEYVAYTEEFLEGSDLRRLIEEKFYPSEKELKELILSLLRAIKEIWSLGYIHRDIKPGNIIRLYEKDRKFVLLDLGIAFSVLETPLTVDAQHRFPPGTFKYIAPEMLQPDFRESIDFRSDIYAIGVTAYEYATNQHPLAQDKEDLITTLSRIVRFAPKSILEYRKDLSPALAQVINQMLKKIPALRPSNLNKLINTLEGEL